MGVQMARTPLHYAAERGHSAVTKLLLEAGADITARDRVRSIVVLVQHFLLHLPQFLFTIFSLFVFHSFGTY